MIKGDSWTTLPLDGTMTTNSKKPSSTQSTTASDTSQTEEEKILARAYELIAQMEAEGQTPHNCVCVLATAATIMCVNNPLDPRKAAANFADALIGNVERSLDQRYLVILKERSRTN